MPTLERLHNGVARDSDPVISKVASTHGIGIPCYRDGRYTKLKTAITVVHTTASPMLLLSCKANSTLPSCVLVATMSTLACFGGTSGECSGSDEALLALLSENCFDCHTGDAAEAGFELDKLISDVPWVRNREDWRRVVQLVEMRSMPPSDVVVMADSERSAIAMHITHRLERFDYSQTKDPGHEPIRRLTHREFENTLNDLLGTRLEIVGRFPRELIGSTGFDNDSSTLSLQPALMERYLPIIEQAVEQGSADWRPISSDEAAKKALRRFLPRAFRRRLSEAETELALGIYERHRENQHSIEASLQQTMKAALASPAFLMRVEVSRLGESAQVSGYELASRLSYFLWASMPDNELFRLATKGALRNTASLARQIERMVAHPKAARFAEAFVGQWLSTDLIGREIRQDPIDEPWCTDTLMDAMRAETALLFLEILRANRPATELVDADYTFVTNELADKLYGLRVPRGRGAHRISLVKTERRGVLGHAAVLAATSGLEHISASKRGAFVLDRLLGTPPPPPPPDAGELDEDLEESDRLSIAEKLSRHARDERCVGCHQRIDPIGMALQRFGPFGRRDDGERSADDGSNTLADGTRLAGVADLREYILTKRRDDFVRNLVERTLEYALNRRLEYFDEPAVRRVIAKFEESDLRMQALVQAIVTSYPFQHRRN